MTTDGNLHLGRQRDFLQAVLNATDIGILVVDRSGPVLFTNDRLSEVWNYSGALADGRQYGQPLLRHMLGQLKEPGVLSSDPGAFGRISAQMAAEAELKDGRVLEILAGPLVIDGLATGGVYQFRDVTERCEAAGALREREAYYREENRRLRAGMGERWRLGGMIGKSPAMQAVFEGVLRAAASDAAVLITGEAGTGRELAARTIHDLSDRRGAPFRVVACGSLDEAAPRGGNAKRNGNGRRAPDGGLNGLMDMAPGGTLFLDEAERAGLETQRRLLRVLDGGAGNPGVRLIAGSRRDLSALVENGAMRRDFFYRIQTLAIHLPPLRERREDIPLLVDHFLRQLGDTQDRGAVMGAVLAEMMRRDWPENVRELKQALRRFLNDRAEAQTSATAAATGADTLGGVLREASGDAYRIAMENFEKSLFLKALERHRWHRAEAARALGLPLRTFYRKMQRLGLSRRK